MSWRSVFRASSVLASGVVLLLVARSAPASRSVEDPPQALPDADDVKDVPAVDIRIDARGRVDPHGPMRFALIGKDDRGKAPPAGYRVLLILPGGDGTMDFHPFVKRIVKNVLDDGWIALQLERPFFAAKQATDKVWPTKSDPWPGQAFGVEDFVKAVVAHAAKRTKIDAKHVYMLGWSSSGPACYATMLAKDTPVMGAFIAMSVFFEQNLPPLGNAKNRAFYLYHSKTDPICKFELAENGRDALIKAKAKVEFVTYEGEHGWPPTVYADLRKGLDWLLAKTP